MATANNDSIHFPPRLILGGALIIGMLLALACHMIGQQFGLNLGGLWRNDSGNATAAAIAWWIMSSMGFVGGYLTASLMTSAASGHLPAPLRNFLIVVLVIFLAAAGQAAAVPSGSASIAGLLTGLVALVAGGVMAFCGAHFALRRDDTK